MTTTLYVETSALLAGLFGENGAKTAGQAIAEADTVVSSAITLLECERVLMRYFLQEGVQEAQYKQLLGVAKRQVASWYLLEITPAVRQRAATRFSVEPVRSLDAIHLASALEFSEACADLSVLSFDRRVRDNLAGLGLKDWQSK